MNTFKKINYKLYIIAILLLLFYSLFLNYSLLINKNKIEDKKENILLNRNYLNNNIKLKDYSNTEFKISDEGKKIINNIRNLHKSPTLIDSSKLDQELCAGYIWTLTEKIWGKESPYYIGMLNLNTKTPSKAWELPFFYTNYGGNTLIDFSEVFSLKDKDFWGKITLDDLKKFFSEAFSEEALFGDIGFFYTKTKYSDFLKNWSYNSHITKNIGISNFEITLDKDYKNETDLEIVSDILGCDKNINKNIFKILENYKLFLNGKQIVLYNNIFYYLENNMILGKMVNFKYRDKFEYRDITLTHFLNSKANVNSLFSFICKGEFYPINIISINKRFIEKF